MQLEIAPTTVVVPVGNEYPGSRSTQADTEDPDTASPVPEGHSMGATLDE